MLVIAAALLAAGAAALAWPRAVGTTSSPPSPPAIDPSAPSATTVPPGQLARRVCASVPHEVLVRTVRGTHPTRSGDLQLIPTFPNFVDGGLTHATPFDHTQRVPLLLFGPGFVRPGVYDEPASLTDLSQTAASLLKFDGFTAPDGRSLDEGLLPAGERRTPKLIVTMVWDSAGTDLLERWADSWPNLRRLSRRGAWFTDVQVGASPSNTPPSHAEIGTGAYPRRNGMVDEYMWVDGRIRKPNSQGPTFMELPTLADRYDLAMDNEPIVGASASLSAHIMMMSHGKGWRGGDADIAITREVQSAATGGDDTADEWGLTTRMLPYYRFPAWSNDDSIDASFEQAKVELDQLDGSLDGLWGSHSIGAMAQGFNTPARTPYQTALFEELVRRERFGADRVPDLLYLNYKMLDSLGHQFSADGEELAQALRIQDADLPTFVDFLDEQVGRGEWVLMLTADHGMQRDPAVNGAFPIDIDRMVAAVERAFDGTEFRPVILKARPTQIWLDETKLRHEGFTVAQVAAFVQRLTQAETAGPSGVQPGKQGTPVFDAVFPRSVIERLPCLPDSVRA
ncbi:MAG: alkaline phosphatase family protein [Actinomycetota bacterium]